MRWQKGFQFNIIALFFLHNNAAKIFKVISWLLSCEHLNNYLYAMGTIKKNAIYNILLSASQLLFPLITFPYVSRVLGPQGIGVVSFIDSLTQYFILVAALGIPIYGVREIAKVRTDPTKRAQVFSELLLIHISSTCLALLVYITVFFSIAKFQAYQHLLLIGSGLLLFQVFMLEWLFQGLEEFPYITKRTLLIRAFSVLAIFLLVKKPQDTLSYYSIFLATLLANAVFNIHYARRFVRFKLVKYKQAIARHWKSLLYIFSLGLVTSVYTLLDTALLGLLSTNTQVGYYATATRLTKLVIMIFVAFATVMIPPLSKAFHIGDRATANRLLKKSFGYMVLLSVPASIGLMVVAPLILRLYAGQEFTDARLSLQILAPTIICISLSNIFGMQILNPTNKEHLFFKAAVVGMVVSVSVNLLLIPFFEHVGAAISALITEFTVLILLGVYALRSVAFGPQWKLLIQAIVASLSFIPIYWAVTLQPLPLTVQLVLMLLLAGMSYIAIQWWLFRNPYITTLWEMFKTKLGLQRKT